MRYVRRNAIAILLWTFRPPAIGVDVAAGILVLDLGEPLRRVDG